MSIVERVFTIPEVAALAGWHRRRMLRHLLKLDEELGGMLLHNIGSRAKPRYTVTMRALRSVAPQWFTDAETVEARIAALEDAIEKHQRILMAHTGSLDRIVRAL